MKSDSGYAVEAAHIAFNTPRPARYLQERPKRDQFENLLGCDIYQLYSS